MTDVFCSHICGCPVSCQPDCRKEECGVEDIPTNKEAPKVTSKDPNSYIQASAETLADTLLSKNSDYAPSGEFSNFERAAEAADVSALKVMAVQAAIKMTRIQSILSTKSEGPLNESLKDSFLDLAGYAIIAHAYLSASEHQRTVRAPIGKRDVGTVIPDPYWLVRDEG